MSSIKKQPNEKKLSDKRRALIKGSAASIPMILTLRSGAALAQTSANCMARLQDNPPDDFQVLVEASEIDNDPYKEIRSITWGRILTPIGGGTPITVFRHPEQQGPEAEWYNVEENTMTGIPFKRKLNKKGKPTKKKRMIQEGQEFSFISTAKDCYVAYWCNLDGSVVEPRVYGAAEAGQFPFAAASCMASIAP